MPLAVDLFCGLFETEFLLRADTVIQQFVASQAD
jgi:hypothetical protein